MMSYCDYLISVVYRASETMASKDISSKTNGLILTKLGSYDALWPSINIVQMVLVHFISRSHRLKIDFQDENFKNILL